MKMKPIKFRQLTPEQITAELKRRAIAVKAKIKRLEELKKVSPETMRMVVTI